jgi:hypothetical protein
LKRERENKFSFKSKEGGRRRSSSRMCESWRETNCHPPNEDCIGERNMLKFFILIPPLASELRADTDELPFKGDLKVDLLHI